MANKYSNLKDLFTAIADAIRAKTGGTDVIVADDFPNAIASIEADKTKDEDAIVDGSITSYTNDRVTGVKPYLFKSGSGNFTLRSVDLPSATAIGIEAFDSCSLLSQINFPKLVTVQFNAFAGCLSLKKVIFPQLASIGTFAFSGCHSLSFVDLSSSATHLDIYEGAFELCYALKTFVIRLQSKVASLNGESVFDGTPIGDGTGYIYVPAALIDQYKAAENWSTYADKFRALEDYTVDGTITGELDESKI